MVGHVSSWILVSCGTIWQSNRITIISTSEERITFSRKYFSSKQNILIYVFLLCNHTWFCFLMKHSTSVLTISGKFETMDWCYCYKHLQSRSPCYGCRQEQVVGLLQSAEPRGAFEARHLYVLPRILGKPVPSPKPEWDASKHTSMWLIKGWYN